MKPPACMTAGQINKALDRLDKARSKLTDEFIAAGRGHEKPSETDRKTDPLAMKHRKLWDQYSALRREVEIRMGPRATPRLPTRGFRPREKC